MKNTHWISKTLYQWESEKDLRKNCDSDYTLKFGSFGPNEFISLVSFFFFNVATKKLKNQNLQVGFPLYFFWTVLEGRGWATGAGAVPSVK